MLSLYKPDPNCLDCKGTGKIQLLITEVDCDCLKYLDEVNLSEDHSFVPEDSDAIINIILIGEAI